MSSKKQGASKEVDIFNGVDSLMLLKDTKEREKLNDIDGRIMLLKSELKTLMHGSKFDKDCDSKDRNLCNPSEVEKRPNELERKQKKETVSENLKDPKEYMITKIEEFNPSSNSTPSKFTDWLDNTINETNSQWQNETFSKMNSFSLPLEVELASNRFSQNKVEELLYKSFIVQNDVEDLSHLYDTSVPKNVRPKRKINMEKNKSEKTSKKLHSEKPVQGKNKQVRTSKRLRKKRVIPLHTSASDIEVINLDSTMEDNKRARTDPSCIDLDLSNYDWSEPFFVDNHHESHSDLQIISVFEIKDGHISNNGPKSNSLEQKEDNENVDKDKQQAKKVWECPVCLEQSKGQEIVATQCGHVFCKTCLESHTLKVKNNCPTCRADLKNKSVITLFNF